MKGQLAVHQGMGGQQTQWQDNVTLDVQWMVQMRNWQMAIRGMDS